MRNNPLRQRRYGGGKAYSLLRAGRDITSGKPAESIEREGYQITVRRNPFWNASAQTGAPFRLVEAFGTSREDAVEQLLLKIQTLKARAAA